MSHTHVFSRLSVAKKRDTFIFSHTTPTCLVIGFNHEITMISPADIYRWCTLSDRGSSKTNPNDFYLCPVNMQPYGILRYYLKEAGPAMDPKSTVPFPPGDYGWFHYDGDRSLPAMSSGTRILYTLEELKDVPQDNIDVDKKDPISSEIEKLVVDRDSGKCVLTHSDDDVVLTWILRPGAAHFAGNYAAPASADDEYDWRPYVTSENVVTMSRELATLFQDNAFGVDVGNNHKIIVFDDMGSAASLLPTHFPMGVGSDRFLFEHFRWSMRVHLMPGDISEDYSVHDIATELDELGHGDDWEMAEEVPLDDPRWRTPVGKDLLRSLLREKLEAEQEEDSAPSSPDA